MGYQVFVYLVPRRDILEKQFATLVEELKKEDSFAKYVSTAKKKNG